MRKDGYYISEGSPWVDWHAGHKFEGIHYRVLMFFDNDKVLMHTDNSSEFDIKEVLLKSSIHDSYKTYDKILEIIIDPLSKWSVKKKFTILSLEVLLDEDLKEYRFVPINKPV
jgi:hypothetical protein